MEDVASRTPPPPPELEPAATRALLAARTELLLTTAREFDDDAVRAPSLLPDWTRGHLLTHLARNADALVNLCTWARTGREIPMYVSAERRNADIEEGSGRSAAALLADVEAGAVALAAALGSIPDDRWTAEVRTSKDVPKPAWWIPMLRLGEIELHHFDLGAGHAPDSWAEVWVHGMLPDAIRDLDERAGEPLELRATDTDSTLGSGGGRTAVGTEAELLAWVTGRADGSALRIEPEGSLPELGTWR